MSSVHVPRRRGPGRGFAAIGVALAAALAAGCVPESETPPTTTTSTSTTTTTIPTQTPVGWGYTKETFSTAQQLGYQLALDPVGRKVYLSDAYWERETRDASTGAITVTPGTGKLVEFDTATRSFVKNHSFLDLTRNTGNGKEGEAHDWTGVTGNSLNSMRTHFSPYGVGVDGTTVDGAGNPDATIITTTARQQGGVGNNPATGAPYNYGGGLVVYKASQGAPTDADRIWAFDDGSPILYGPRRVAVNTQTHKAYVTNLGAANIPGFVAVVNLLTKQVEARVQIPAEVGGHAYPGAVGIAVDEATNRIYVGTINGTKLFVIDGAAVDTSNAKDFAINTGAVTELPAVVNSNARPTFSPELKKLYVSSYPSRGGVGLISVVDADTASGTYGQVVDTIENVNVAEDITTNAVEIDGQRGLLYSADLDAREVVVYDTDTNEEVLRLPTSGNALNIGIDPVTRDVWVSNFSNSGKVDVFTVHEVYEYSTSDGATYRIPATWVEGRPLSISGTGWKNFPGTEGSVIAVKYNQGQTIPNPDLGLPGDGVWAVITADADGNFSAQVPYPGPTNADQPFVAGSTYNVHLLTGMLGNDDRVRSPARPVLVTSAG